MNYRFLESSSDAKVDILITNFDHLVIQNNVSVTVSIKPTATNATEEGT